MINIWKRLLTILQRIGDIGKAEEGAYAEAKKRAKKPRWPKILTILIVIFVLVVVLYGGYWFMVKNPLGASFRQDIGSWISAGWSGLWQKISGLKKQAMGLGEWGPYVSEEEKKEEKGVEVTSITPFKKPYLVGDDVVVMIEGEVHALEKPGTVEFGCSMDGKEGTVDKESLFVTANLDTLFGVRCDLGKAEEVKDVKHPKVKFSAVYNDFENAAKLKLYTLSEAKLNELVGINPFDYYDVPGEPTLNKEKRTTQADCGYGKTSCGPLKIDLRVPALQPLSDGKHTLIITVKNDPFWGGKFVKDETGYLELEFLGNIRPDCETFKELSSEDQQIFDCDFYIEGVSDYISTAEIRAKAVFNYEFTGEKTITIASKEAYKA